MPRQKGVHTCTNVPQLNNRPLAVGVAQHLRLAILEYNPPCIVIEAYKCFDAYFKISGLQMHNYIIPIYDNTGSTLQDN